MDMVSTTHQPLADRMRPRNFDEFVGQEHIAGSNALFRKLIEQDTVPSMILWGPPGSGKTTLARIIANTTNAELVQLSATMHGVKELRETFDRAVNNRDSLLQKKTLLFIDEIHRFNKAQQDALLPHVEDGTITLIGATTENPSFEVNNAILSRTRVFVLNALEISDVLHVLNVALRDIERGLGRYTILIDDDVKEFLAQFANGDARIALNVLEIATLSKLDEPSDKVSLTIEDVKEVLQQKHLLYDRNGEEHYNTISAFIKSMRASDPDASLYYLARMVVAGEDPLFIARRMVIFASEDIGMAQPTALVVANEVFRACETIGYPECQINMAHGVVYLATCPKSRASYDAYFSALEDAKSQGNVAIPLHLRNAPTTLMKDLGYGYGYEKYPKDTSFLPDSLKGKRYYKG